LQTMSSWVTAFASFILLCKLFAWFGAREVFLRNTGKTQTLDISSLTVGTL